MDCICIHRKRVIAWRSYKACFWRWPKDSSLLHGFVDPQYLKILDAQWECVVMRIQCHIEAHICKQQAWGCLERVVIAIKKAVSTVLWSKLWGSTSIWILFCSLFVWWKLIECSAHNVLWIKNWGMLVIAFELSKQQMLAMSCYFALVVACGAGFLWYILLCNALYINLSDWSFKAKYLLSFFLSFKFSLDFMLFLFDILIYNFCGSALGTIIFSGLMCGLG